MSPAGPGEQVVSHYELLGLVGQGAMGRVVKALDRNLNRVVALKFLAPQHLESPEARQRFFREARTISALSHPNIATIYAIEEHAGEPFLALEFLSGGTLTDRTRGRRLPMPELLSYARQLAAGLEHAHRHGVIHRDVKPANVLFSDEDRLKLVDFGLAKWARATATAHQSGCCGTPAYMAPELMREEEADHRSDIYSFGVVVYELAAGRLPHMATQPIAMFRSVLESSPPPLRTLRPDLPPALCTLISQCMSKARQHRPGSMDQVLSKLDRIEPEAPAAALDSITVTLPPASGTRITLSRRQWILASSAVPLAVVAGVAGLPLLRRLWAPRGLGALRLVAVLPFESADQSPAVQEFSLGLHARLASLLVQAEQWQSAISVPPASEISANNVRTVEDARKRLTCDLVFSGSVLRSREGYEIILSLTEAATRRQLQSRIVRVPYEELPRQDSILLQAALELLRPALTAAPLMAASAAPLLQHNPVAYELCLRAEGVLRRFEGASSVDAALALLDQAIELDPGSAAAHALRAEALVRKYGNTRDAATLESARAASAKAVALNPDLREVAMASGRVAQAAGRYQDAVDHLERAIQIAPADQEALRLLGMALVRARKPAEAEAVLRRAIAASPAYWPAYSTLGWFLYTQNRTEEAVAEYQSVVRLAPEIPDGYRHLGAMFVLLGRETEAIAQIEESLSRGAIYKDYINLGTLRFYLGQFDAAAADYRQAVTLQPKAPEAWAYLGEALEQVPGKQAQSREAFERAIELSREQLQANANDAALWIEAAFASAKLQRRTDAYPAIERAVALAPDDSRVLYRAGCAAEILGNRARALRYIGKAVELGESERNLMREPVLALLRDDPAFSALRNRAPRQ